MNTNSNTYTVLYSIGLVVVVAAVLAFVAKFLQPMQEANVKKDTISQILKAADIKFTDNNILETYKSNLQEAILVDVEGNKVGTLDKAKCEVYTNSQLKAEITATSKKLPVYIFENVIVVPCYGPGLWGPIWGYIGIDKNDYKTIKSVCFGHKGETPGLGAKIADDPDFAKKFVDQCVNEIELENKTKLCFEIAKKANRQTTDHGVDAISGATITSQALGKALNQWLGFYQGYLNSPNK